VSRYLENVGASTSHNPMGLHDTVPRFTTFPMFPLLIHREILSDIISVCHRVTCYKLLIYIHITCSLFMCVICIQNFIPRAPLVHWFVGYLHETDNFVSYTKTNLLKTAILWDITPCSPLSVNRRFGGTYRLHLQGLNIS
jgi:hypothetical protein